MSDYDAAAAVAYEGEAEHALAPGEPEAWIATLAGLGHHPSRATQVLDLGAGTGLLTAALAHAGYAVTGLEPSPDMVAEAERRRPGLVVLVTGRAEDAEALGSRRFDVVVSRQVLCHLRDPAAAFANLGRWLRPGGHAVLSDGFWPRSAWSAAALDAQPFAAVVSTEPVAALLAQAGLEVVSAGRFEAVNRVRLEAAHGATPRYIVVVRRP